MSKTRLIWDIPTRVFHWLLTLSLTGSFVTANLGVEYTEWHMRLGYTALGLILFRITWGVVGTTYARFAQFAPTPSKFFKYASTLLQKDSTPSAGHNPIGALMVFLLMLLVTVQGVTGLFVTDDILYMGPYNGVVSADMANELTTLHHKNADLLLMAIGLHVLAVLFYLLYKKQNLVAAMFTGKKTLPDPGEGIKSSRLGVAIVVAVLAAFSIYLLLWLAPEPVYTDFY